MTLCQKKIIVALDRKTIQKKMKNLFKGIFMRGVSFRPFFFLSVSRVNVSLDVACLGGMSPGQSMMLTRKIFDHLKSLY